MTISVSVQKKIISQKSKNRSVRFQLPESEPLQQVALEKLYSAYPHRLELLKNCEEDYLKNVQSAHPNRIEQLCREYRIPVLIRLIQPERQLGRFDSKDDPGSKLLWLENEFDMYDSYRSDKAAKLRPASLHLPGQSQRFRANSGGSHFGCSGVILSPNVKVLAASLHNLGSDRLAVQNPGSGRPPDPQLMQRAASMSYQEVQKKQQLSSEPDATVYSLEAELKAYNLVEREHLVTASCWKMCLVFFERHRNKFGIPKDRFYLDKDRLQEALTQFLNFSDEQHIPADTAQYWVTKINNEIESHFKPNAEKEEEKIALEVAEIKKAYKNIGLDCDVIDQNLAKIIEGRDVPKDSFNFFPVLERYISQDKSRQTPCTEVPTYPDFQRVRSYNKKRYYTDERAEQGNAIPEEALRLLTKLDQERGDVVGIFTNLASHKAIYEALALGQMVNDKNDSPTDFVTFDSSHQLVSLDPCKLAHSLLIDKPFTKTPSLLGSQIHYALVQDMLSQRDIYRAKEPKDGAKPTSVKSAKKDLVMSSEG